MKKVILSIGLFLFGITAFCQQEETNGTIYIKHPYIDVVNNTTKAYEAQDWDAKHHLLRHCKVVVIGNGKIYSDSRCHECMEE